MMIKIKRVYEKPEDSDGYRILVDRLWPRGISKQDAKIDEWLKEIAPSTGLRKWFSHDVKKWKEFKERYSKELDDIKETVRRLKNLEKRKGKITLLYAARDTEHNNAGALLEYLNEMDLKEDVKWSGT